MFEKLKDLAAKLISAMVLALVILLIAWGIALCVSGIAGVVA